MGFYLQTAFANFKFDNTIQLNYKWGYSLGSLDKFHTEYIVCSHSLRMVKNGKNGKFEIFFAKFPLISILDL